VEDKISNHLKLSFVAERPPPPHVVSQEFFLDSEAPAVRFSCFSPLGVRSPAYVQYFHSISAAHKSSWPTVFGFCLSLTWFMGIYVPVRWLKGKIIIIIRSQLPGQKRNFLILFWMRGLLVTEENNRKYENPQQVRIVARALQNSHPGKSKIHGLSRFCGRQKREKKQGYNHCR